MPNSDSNVLTVAPQAVLDLVEKFAEHHDTYHRAGYNESQLRADFLDPLFDQLVYELYGLTDKEIAIVEDATCND